MTKSLADRGADESNCSVSLIVPMRNEERNVRDWITAAAAQTHPAIDVIVADDSSTDDTYKLALAAAARDPRVQVIGCLPPPAGWVGKPWAAYCGATASASRWLLFSDADIRMAPETVGSALAAARAQSADVVSLTATLEARGLWETIVLPAMASLIATGYPMFLIHSDRSAVALVWGAFILVRRDAYFRCGGHAAVRGEIAEDRALAQRLKAFGYRIRLFDGSSIASVRMYHGFAEMWEGWRKNLYDGARRNPVYAALFVMAAIAALVLPLPLLGYLLVVRAARRWSRGQGVLAVLCGLAAVCAICVRRLRDPAVGAPPSAALGTPLAGAYIAAVMAASAWRCLSGRGQTWKGRTIT
ncbi:MAG: glycosyltransferase family 2 protein [Candidatus Eremiobacteraeota bacterium]|nr:glycosyltransferase family 2 protein [Candidatus Eremiobacteraeota bacterium]